MKPKTVLYATVTFLSAFLLFLLEPIAARRLLPLFGGSASVWTTCLIFFQCALLAGYGYAHIVVRRFAAPKQAIIHIVLLLVSLLSLALPRAQVDASGVAWHPVASILWMLTSAIGLPFLALSATSPLLQAWYALANPGQLPPWWLFALSNSGSLLALLLYPAVVEPGLTLPWQAAVWHIGFCVFAVFCGMLALGSRRQAENANKSTIPYTNGGVVGDPAPSGAWPLWILLPACGSMLLCAVTNHLGENIAAIPLLWIVPLAAYLLSFVVAFASSRAWPRWIAVRMLALTLATFAYLLYNSRTSLPPQISIPVYTLALFFGCLFCHSELYRRRPAAVEVTNFYLFVSLGSAVGAILVGVAAPNFFHANYDVACTVIVLAATSLAATWEMGMLARLAWAGAAVGLVYVASVQANALAQDAIVQLRSFYGSLRVTQTHLPPIAETTRTLYHGRIQHGTQNFGDGFRTQPSSYYAHSSGIGLTLDLCCESRTRRIGVVGLGTGTVAAYGRAGDEITFYEIDPLVERLARALFTYLSDSPAKVRVVLGDARLSLAREQNSSYDVLVLDAFSGDAVPVHLLTAQAIALYLRHLRPDGVLVFNISSQYLDLAPQLALLARNAGLRSVLVHSGGDEDRGQFAADWLLMSSPNGLLQLPEVANAAQPINVIPGLRLWTDDYSSLLPLLKWRPIVSKSTGADTKR